MEFIFFPEIGANSLSTVPPQKANVTAFLVFIVFVCSPVGALTQDQNINMIAPWNYGFDYKKGQSRFTSLLT